MVILWNSFKSLIRGIWKIITSNIVKIIILAASLITTVIAIRILIIFSSWSFNLLRQLFADPNSREYALEIVNTYISAAGLIATVIAAIGLLVNYFSVTKNIQLNEESLTTDRFTKAVEQIGSKTEEVVIGGIYSLERITKDSPKDQWTIMEVLTAFVRKNSPIPAEIKELDNKTEDKIKALEQLKPVTIQVQAALTVIGRRDPRQDNIQEDKRDKFLDLGESNLKSVLLYDADLGEAILRNANLKSAKLWDTNLCYVAFQGANLEHADLERANLEHAYLEYANLKDAKLYGANLKDADLYGANLKNADLFAVKNLSKRQIKSACFWKEAIHTELVFDEKEQKWVLDEQANKQKIEEIEQDKASDPKNLPDYSKWPPKN